MNTENVRIKLSFCFSNYNEENIFQVGEIVGSEVTSLKDKGEKLDKQR